MSEVRGHVDDLETSGEYFSMIVHGEGDGFAEGQEVVIRPADEDARMPVSAEVIERLKQVRDNLKCYPNDYDTVNEVLTYLCPVDERKPDAEVVERARELAATDDFLRDKMPWSTMAIERGEALRGLIAAHEKLRARFARSQDRLHKATEALVSQASCEERLTREEWADEVHSDTRYLHNVLHCPRGGPWECKHCRADIIHVMEALGLEPNTEDLPDLRPDPDWMDAEECREWLDSIAEDPEWRGAFRRAMPRYMMWCLEHTGTVPDEAAYRDLVRIYLDAQESDE
jgi:hypothetical protein